MIGARGRAGQVPIEMLTVLLEKLEQDALWIEFAYQGKEEVEYVLDNYPKLVSSIAEAGLHFAPEKTLAILLSAAVGDKRSLSSHTDHPLRQVETWILAARPGTEYTITIRKLLLKKLAQWLSLGNDIEVACKAINLALQPGHKTVTANPGSGMVITFVSSMLTKREIEQLATVWDEAVKVLTNATASVAWNEILDLIETWAYPNRSTPGTISDEVRGAMRAQAVRMIQDVAPLLANHEGFTERLRQIGRSVGVNVSTPADSKYSTLFPRENLRQWRKNEESQKMAVKDLAEQWSIQSADDIAHEVVRLEARANEAGVSWPRYTPLLMSELATNVTSPLLWTKAFVSAGALPHIVDPLITRATQIQEQGWEETLFELLDHPSQVSCVLPLIITLKNPPQRLLDKTQILLNGRYAQSIQFHCQRNEVPVETLRMLLAHEDEGVSTAAAIGVWHGVDKGQIPETVARLWESAILRASDDGYWIGQILASNNGMALQWLSSWFTSEERASYAEPEWLFDVYAVLSHEDKVNLLNRIPQDAYWAGPAINTMVIGDSKLAEHLFKCDHLKEHQLGVISAVPEEEVAATMLFAFAANYSVQDVADALIPSFWSWSGSESEMLKSWIKKFEKIGAHPNTQIQKSAQLAKKNIQERLEVTLAEEHRQAVFGR